MGYFIGIAFWILLSGCLLTQSKPVQILSSTSEFYFLDRLKDVTCPADSTFYAPNSVNKKCITTALDCAYKELNGTAKAECKNKDYINDVLEILERRLKERAQPVLTNSTDCACEKEPQMSLSDFAKAVKILFKFENTMNSQKPTTTNNLRLCSGQDNLRLCFLGRDVECENVMFASPANVEVNCFDAALQSFKDGLVRAATSCKDEDERINDTLETLVRFPSTNSTECTLDTKESQFKDFVKDLETFVQHFNTNSRT